MIELTELRNSARDLQIAELPPFHMGVGHFRVFEQHEKSKTMFSVVSGVGCRSLSVRMKARVDLLVMYNILGDAYHIGTFDKAQASSFDVSAPCLLS